MTKDGHGETLEFFLLGTESLKIYGQGESLFKDCKALEQ